MLRFAGTRASLAAIFFLLAVQADRLAAGPAVQQASVPSLLGFIDSALAEGRLRAAQDLITRARAQSDDPEVRLREAELLLASAVLPAALAAFDEHARLPAAAAVG